MDKRKRNGRKKGRCQSILESGEPCKKDGDTREVLLDQHFDHGLMLRVRVCGMCWEGK